MSSKYYEQAENLSPEEKRTLLAKLLHKKATSSNSFPLSYSQQRLWFLDQLWPGRPTYNITYAIRLQGNLNIRVLEQTLSEIIRRHKVLRTTFDLVDEQPVQIISPAEPLSLPLQDLSSFSPSEQQQHLPSYIREQAQLPFDLRRGPLLRASLLRLNDNEQIAVLVMHHIISDGWSMGVLVREVATLYRAFAKGQPSPLPELPIQYADYAVWQRQWLSGERLQEQIEYWRARLHGAPQILELPTDRPRPPVQGFGGGGRTVRLGEQLSEELKACARAQGATLFMVLLAGFEVLLWKYTGETDVVVGTPIANRNRVETRDLIGFFVNTLVVRGKLEQDARMAEVIQQVREEMLGAYAHQELPFEKLVEELQPERSMSHQPLFQVMFILQNAPVGALELPGVILSGVELDAGAAQFDLTLSIVESEHDLTAVIEYNTDLYEEETVERMLGHYVRLLKEIVRSPEAPISQLALVTALEQQQILTNRKQVEVGAVYRPRCIHELFEEQVVKTPESTAIETGATRVSYRELNERANQVGHYLREQGVGPEVIVGICMERSVEMVVAVLGVLKAGGAYVPLDPSYPLERLSFMLGEAGAPLLLTQERLRSRLPGQAAKVIALDAEWEEEVAGQRRENPESGVVTENLAYLIYTSGSTGTPKGVSVTHRGLANLARVQQEEFGVRAGSRVQQFASLSFDASVSELFVTLTAGATLCLPETREPLVGEAWLEELERQEINVVTVPPSMLAVTEGRELRHLQSLVVAGEACGRGVAAGWSGRVERMINAYGPSEATVCASVNGEVGAELEVGGREPSIGRVIEHVELYLLDEQMQPAPIGVTGELYIGGVGLARGYWRRPELTGEKFVPHPFSGSGGERLYRTGDLGRYLADGRVEFLGRRDQQVKLRGYRIELGEIETMLRQQTGVQDAVVVVDQSPGGEKRLVGYVARAEDAEAVTMSQWRSWLSEQLPDYMIPAVMVELTELPLTPNGKVDRRALPEPDGARPELKENFVQPRTELEKNIGAIWAEVLGLERVGIHDNFFELGGHSLMMIKIHSKLKASLNTEIAVVHLFEYPTVSALTKFLTREQSEKPSSQSGYKRAETRRASQDRQRQLRLKDRSVASQ